MSIIRVKKQKAYFSIQNKIVTDTKLNDEAFRLYCYLMSNSDDWTIFNRDIMKKLNWTSHKLNKALKNLKENGFITRERKNDKGVFNWETTVYEEALTIPRISMHGNSIDGSTMNGKTSDIINTKENKTKINKEENNINQNPPFNFLQELGKLDLQEPQLSLLKAYWQESKTGAKTRLAFDILIRELKKLNSETQIIALEKAYQGKYASIQAEWFNKPQTKNNFQPQSTNLVGAKSSYELGVEYNIF